MSNDFIASQISRSNRNLLIVNLTIFVVAGVFIAFTYGFVAGFVFGGAKADTSALATLRADSFKILEVDATDVEQTGYQKVKRKNGVESAVWDYLVIPAGNRVLVVQAKTGNRGPHFTGVLKPMPGELSAMIQQDIKDPAERAAVLPVMLDAIEYRGDAVLMLLIPFPLLLLSAWNLKKWMQRSADPMTHPIQQKLQTRGGMMAAQQIDSEMAQAPPKMGKSYLTRNWILGPYFFGMHVMHVDDVVWAYKKVVKHYHGFIPTGKTYATVLCGASGTTVEINDKEKPVEELLGALAERAPWIAMGFSDDVQSIWQSNRDALVQAVNQRRSELTRKAPAAQAMAASPA